MAIDLAVVGALHEILISFTALTRVVTKGVMKHMLINEHSFEKCIPDGTQLSKIKTNKQKIRRKHKHQKTIAIALMKCGIEYSNVISQLTRCFVKLVVIIKNTVKIYIKNE